MKKVLFIVAVFYSSLLVTACSKQGSMEKAGERADEVIDNAKEGQPLLHKKGPLEKAGESVDEELERLKKN